MSLIIDPIEPPNDQWPTIPIQPPALELGIPGPGTWAQVWRRKYATSGNQGSRPGTGNTFVWERVDKPFKVESATVTSHLSKIGRGTLTTPLGQAYPTGVTIGDVVTVFIADGNPYRSKANHRRIGCFIVKNRTYRSGKLTLDGPDMLGELQDYIAFNAIGEETTTRLEITEGNGGQRFKLIKDSYDGTTTPVTTVRIWGDSDFNPNTDDSWDINVDDEIHIPLAAGGFHVTTIRGLRDDTADGGNNPTALVDLTDSITSITKLENESEQVIVYSKRIETTEDGADLSPGDRIWMYTSAPDPYTGYFKHTTRIDKINQAPDSDLGETRYYIYMDAANIAPIPTLNPLDQEQPNEIVATTYGEPTTDDVAQLLADGTGGAWQVRRDAACDVGTTYEPNGDTVWDTLLAIAEMNGYGFKLVKDFDNAEMPDRRVIRFLNPQRASNLTTGTLMRVANEDRKGDDFGALIGTPELTDSQDIVTHLIPFGAGTGYNRFTIYDSQPLPILNEYFERTGRRYVVQYTQNYTYIRRDTEFTDATREVWRTRTWDNIRPINEANVTNRREAANNLLRAGLDYLESTRELNKAYVVNIMTYADPQPGDVLPALEFLNAEPINMRHYNLIISEVEHSVGADGVRKTQLVLVKNITQKDDGASRMARFALDLERIKRSTNASSAGGTIQRYDRTIYRGQAVVGTVDGPIVIKSQNDDVRVTAADDVIVSGDRIYAYGEMTVNDDLIAKSGVTIPDQDTREYTLTMRVINGRARLVRSAVPPTDNDAPRSDDPDFVGNIYP